jgi:hypothetical protein
MKDLKFNRKANTRCFKLIPQRTAEQNQQKLLESILLHNFKVSMREQINFP